jgi:hypothetical protein
MIWSHVLMICLPFSRLMMASPHSSNSSTRFIFAGNVAEVDNAIDIDDVLNISENFEIEDALDKSLLNGKCDDTSSEDVILEIEALRLALAPLLAGEGPSLEVEPPLFNEGSPEGPKTSTPKSSTSGVELGTPDSPMDFIPGVEEIPGRCAKVLGQCHRGNLYSGHAEWRRGWEARPASSSSVRGWDPLNSPLL